MNFPPTKRLRGLNHQVAPVVTLDDPFGDDDGFTQDVLDEIDIIASQAINSATAETDSKPAESARRPSAGPSRSLSSRDPAKPSRKNTFGFSSSSRGNAPNREPLVNRQEQQQFGSDRQDSYRELEAQHADLKRKLKEVEDEIVLKSGEIRVLRDSLKSAQQEKEAQRQSQTLLETQRQTEQSHREKELNKKVQSLQSELQFKEAEINDMKSKMQISDRNKTSSPLNRNSPKVLSPLAQSHHASSASSSPAGSGFITKETFGAQVPLRTTPMKTLMKTRREERTGSSSRSGEGRGEVQRPDPFLRVRPAHLQCRGGVLLGLLLQQPLSPSSLGLSHLLSMSLTHVSPTSSRLSTGFLQRPDNPAGGDGGEGASRAALSPVQSLAVTGLNMLSQGKTAAAASNSRCCPGAVLLLPLLDLHLLQLCSSLDSFPSGSARGLGSGSSGGTGPALPPGSAAAPGRAEEAGSSGFSVEETGLASLRLLHLLLVHSDEVVTAVLSEESRGAATDEKTEPSAADLSSQNSLLQSVLRLCEAGGGGGGAQREGLVLSAMKTLGVLIERTPQTHTDRLQCVLQVMCACVSADMRLQSVSECVSILTSMSDHTALTQQLFAQHDPCVFLKLFLYIRMRPDNQAAHTGWVELDLKVVCLLNRLLTQGAEIWSKRRHGHCQCHTELVQTVVMVFHRQWLELRDCPEPTDSTGPPAVATPFRSAAPWWRGGSSASLLRRCLLLLHWLLLHHSSFSESCRPLLHMYDQVIPAVRDTLRKIPGLSESEELALEEICRSEGDDTDDMETDD